MSARSKFARRLEALYDQQVADLTAEGIDRETAHSRALVVTVATGHAALTLLRGTPNDPLGEEAGDA